MLARVYDVTYLLDGEHVVDEETEEAKEVVSDARKVLRGHGHHDNERAGRVLPVIAVTVAAVPRAPGRVAT